MHTPTKPLWILVGLLVIVPAVQIIFAVLIWLVIPNSQERGMFGAMNALFSGLAFAGIVYTILLQRAEFSTNVTSAERAARISAISALLAAYAEGARYLDTRAAPQTGKVSELQERIDVLAQQLQVELALSRATQPDSSTSSRAEARGST